MRLKVLIKLGSLAVAGISAFCVFVVLFLMSAKDPKIVLIYTQKEIIPDIAFKISSVPLALASYIKYRSVEFAALPATTQNIETALSEAEFVVVGTHGWNGMLYSDEGAYIGPTKTSNFKMRSIYFGSCYFGTMRKKWEDMLPNAQVMGHDNETYQITGWMYLVFKSWIDLLKY